MHRPVHDATFVAGDDVAARALSNGIHAEIDVRRQAAIEPHLLLAECRRAGRSRKSRKPKSTGRFTFHTSSPVRNTHDACVIRIETGAAWRAP
jgi:hypothetical protein